MADGLRKRNNTIQYFKSSNKRPKTTPGFDFSQAPSHAVSSSSPPTPSPITSQDAVTPLIVASLSQLALIQHNFEFSV